MVVFCQMYFEEMMMIMMMMTWRMAVETVCIVVGVGYSVGSEPFNLAQQSGSFEVTSVSRAAAADNDADVQGNKVMTQVVTQPPVDTCTPERMPRPLALIGDFQW